MGEAGSTYSDGKCLQSFGWGNLKERTTLGRRRRRWVDNIKTDFKEVGRWEMGWVDLVQDVVKWRAVVNTAMNRRVT
jgi:hypothetical protein